MLPSLLCSLLGSVAAVVLLCLVVAVFFFCFFFCPVLGYEGATVPGSCRTNVALRTRSLYCSGQGVPVGTLPTLA